MALTKNKIKEILSAAGVPSDKIDGAADEIMNGHVTSINALREERDGYKADAEKLPGVQKELDDLKKTVADGGDWEKKFKDSDAEFKKFKAEVEAEKVKGEKTKLFKAALKAANVDEKRFDAILKVTDLDKLTVKDGKFADEKAVNDGIKTDWADFIVTTKTDPGKVETPPASGGGQPQLESRAAQLAAKYNASLYGVAKDGQK